MHHSRQCQPDHPHRPPPDTPMPSAQIHLVKLCVGISSALELATHQAEGIRTGRYDQPEHRTLHRPRRWEELVAGGSIYWVIRGMICVRQRITAIESCTDGTPERIPAFGRRTAAGRGCLLVFSPLLTLTAQYPMRPFQGWRYLDADDAPPDLGRLPLRPGPTPALPTRKPGHRG